MRGGWGRWLRVAPVAGALVMAGAAVSTVDPALAVTAVPTITTVAGGTGQGPATTIGQRPIAVVRAGSLLLIADAANGVIRRLDTTTGAETVVAGDAAWTTSYDLSVGDGRPATMAVLHTPSSVAVDLAGNLYIADTWHHRVRKVDSKGTITTVAGTGQPAGWGGDGDGGPAAAAALYHPQGVAVDAAGSLYIADTGNCRVRKVDGATGTIATVAGTYCGYGGDGGPALSAQMNWPEGLVLDGAGTLYVADYWNHRVRAVSTSGTISTLAGQGSGGFGGYGGDGGPGPLAQLSFPTAVVIDPAGSVYVADSGNNRIRAVDRSGIIRTVVGTGAAAYGGDAGPATDAQVDHPQGVELDAAGGLLVADTSNRRVRRVDAAGIINTIAGDGWDAFGGDGGVATKAQVRMPRGVVAGPKGSLFIADTENNRVREIDGSGVITTIAGTGMAGYGGDGGPATVAQLNRPAGLAIDATGQLYVADTYNYRIRKIDRKGIITAVAGCGTQCGSGGDGGPGAAAGLFLPAGVAVDAGNNIYIADTFDQRIRRVDALTGVITTVAGTGPLPFGAGYTGDGPGTTVTIGYPFSVAADGRGNVYFDDGNKIRKLDTTGFLSTLAGSDAAGYDGDGGPASAAHLYSPFGVAVDADGSTYIADTYNARVRKVDASGIITTVAGNGTAGFNGDDGPATLASLQFPVSVAVGPAGSLLVTDTFNSRIRRVARR